LVCACVALVGAACVQPSVQLLGVCHAPPPDRTRFTSVSDRSDPAVALREAAAPASPRLAGAMAAVVLDGMAVQPGMQPLPGAVLELGALLDL